jgi:hypothetical protein
MVVITIIICETTKEGNKLLENGVSCTENKQCKDNYCKMMQVEDGEDPRGTCNENVDDYFTCSTDADCATEHCNLLAGDGPTCLILNSKKNGIPCRADNECSGGHCVQLQTNVKDLLVCSDPVEDYYRCSKDGDCESGYSNIRAGDYPSCFTLNSKKKDSPCFADNECSSNKCIPFLPPLGK